MKKSISHFAAGTVCFLTMTSGLQSCRPEECTLCMEEPQPSTLTLNLLPGGLKSTSAQSQEQDNTVNTLDVFVFGDGLPDSPERNRLDAYSRFTGAGLEDLTLSTTTGQKIICVIANSHTDSYSGITDLASFRTLITDLRDERLGDFTMYGETKENLGINATVNISLSRFVARVDIAYIKTRFEGTPYEGMTLDNCRLFLANASGDMLVSGGIPPENPLVLNRNGLVEEDAGSTAETGLIMDVIPGEIGNSGYSTPHFLYCYSNETEDIATSTRLVLQADLDGVTYYYPIPVNQPGYGDPETYGHTGIRRNTAYSYGITITRPGSPDPMTPLEPGDMELSVEVADWTFIPVFEKRF